MLSTMLFGGMALLVVAVFVWAWQRSKNLGATAAQREAAALARVQAGQDPFSAPADDGPQSTGETMFAGMPSQVVPAGRIDVSDVTEVIDIDQLLAGEPVAVASRARALLEEPTNILMDSDTLPPRPASPAPASAAAALPVAEKPGQVSGSWAARAAVHAGNLPAAHENKPAIAQAAAVSQALARQAAAKEVAERLMGSQAAARQATARQAAAKEAAAKAAALEAAARAAAAKAAAAQEAAAKEAAAAEAAARQTAAREAAARETAAAAARATAAREAAARETAAKEAAAKEAAAKEAAAKEAAAREATQRLAARLTQQKEAERREAETRAAEQAAERKEAERRQAEQRQAEQRLAEQRQAELREAERLAEQQRAAEQARLAEQRAAAQRAEEKKQAEETKRAELAAASRAAAAAKKKPPVKQAGAQESPDRKLPLRELALAWFEARGYRGAPASEAVRPIELVLRHKDDPARAYAFVVEADRVSADRVYELRAQARSIGLVRVLIVADAGADADALEVMSRKGVRLVDRAALDREFGELDFSIAAKIIAVARKRAAFNGGVAPHSVGAPA